MPKSNLQTKIIAEMTTLVQKELDNAQFAEGHSKSKVQLEHFFGTQGLVTPIPSVEPLVETCGDKRFHEPRGFLLDFPKVKDQHVLK